MHIRRKSGIVAALAVALLSLGIAGNVAAAASATLRVVPSSGTVAKGATFTIRVVQNATIATSGTSATVTFDKSKVQIQSVDRGKAHLSSAVYLPADLPGAIAKANTTGELKTIATAFYPPDAVPAGDQDFLIITLSAIGCGQANFGLPVGKVDAVMLDGTEAGYGNTVPVTTKGASVNVDCAAAAPTGSAAATGTDTTGTKVSTNNNNAAPVETVAGAAAAGDSNPAAGGTGDSASSGSGSGASLPLWLPLLLAIPALVLIGFVLLKRPVPSRS